MPYLRKGLRAVPLIRGGQEGPFARYGGHPPDCRPGCRRVLGRERMEEHTAALTDLKAYALETFPAGVPGLAVVSQGGRAPICAISLPGYPSQVVGALARDRGFCVSSGSACHRGRPAMSMPPCTCQKGCGTGVLRISFGPENTRQGGGPAGPGPSGGHPGPGACKGIGMMRGNRSHREAGSLWGEGKSLAMTGAAPVQ